MNELWKLFASFVKIGAFTFGGGYAMLPMLRKEIVERHQWATDDEIMDYFAIGQCTPGVIAVNTATFIGYKRKGMIGGIVATLGVICPSIIIILLIAMFLKNFSEYSVVKYAFGGIRVCVCILILNAVLKLGKKSLPDLMSVIIFAVVLLLALWGKIETAFLVLGAGVFGLLLYFIKRNKKNTVEISEEDTKHE